MAAVESEDIEQRFATLPVTANTIGATIVGKLKDFAHEINKLVGEASPAFHSVIQRLEQAAHVASTASALQAADQVAADPTQAASPSATDAADGDTPGQAVPSSEAPDETLVPDSTGTASSPSSESSSTAPSTNSEG